MSDFVVHFSRGEDNDEGYKNIMGILSSASLVPKDRFGVGKNIAPSGTNQRAVCFSEIPPGEWGRLHTRRQTRHGIGFKKELLIRDGGGPIWYAWKETPHWGALQEMMSNSRGDPNAPIWKLTPMIDAPGDYGGRTYLFDWEREWRYTGIYRFDPDEVAFLIIPEESHEDAWNFFQMAHDEQLGPAYFCPYIDPSWNKERIYEALRE